MAALGELPRVSGVDCNRTSASHPPSHPCFNKPCLSSAPPLIPPEPEACWWLTGGLPVWGPLTPKCAILAHFARPGVPSQRPPAKPEACRRVSGSKPLGPSGGDRTRQPKRTPNSPVSILCKSFLVAEHSPGCAFTQILPSSSDHRQTFPATHTPGTVKLWESLRQSRRVSRSSKLSWPNDPSPPFPHPRHRPNWSGCHGLTLRTARGASVRGLAMTGATDELPPSMRENSACVG